MTNNSECLVVNTNSAAIMDSISIVLATNDHLRFIPGIEVAAAAMFSERDLPLGVRHRVSTMDALRIAVDASRLWIAEKADNRAVGFAVADILDGQAYLEEMDVLPEFGRQGIGTQLLTTVIAWARDENFSELRLVTFRHLAWNAPFYAKLGFKALDSGELEPEIAGLIEEEGRIGIDTDNRVAMRLGL